MRLSVEEMISHRRLSTVSTADACLIRPEQFLADKIPQSHNDEPRRTFESEEKKASSRCAITMHFSTPVPATDVSERKHRNEIKGFTQLNNLS
jgi:hypothetical protein